MKIVVSAAEHLRISLFANKFRPNRALRAQDGGVLGIGSRERRRNCNPIDHTDGVQEHTQ